MKIYDCSLFFNEIDLLEIRLNILEKYVDHFVIVESNITFQGSPKPLSFLSHEKRLEKFLHKIIYFPITDSPQDFSSLPAIRNLGSIDGALTEKIYQFINECPHFDKKTEYWWGNDFFQRECIRRGLAKAQPNPRDLILISDADEILNPEIIPALIESLKSRDLISIQQNEFCYYLNYLHNLEWLGTCAFLYGSHENIPINSLRFSGKRKESVTPLILQNGGWHFTSLGGVAAVQKKIESWGHKEYNNWLIKKSLGYNIRHGYDIFRRPSFGKLKWVSPESSFLPKFTKQQLQSLKNFFGEPIIKENTTSRFLINIGFRIFNSLIHVWKQ